MIRANAKVFLTIPLESNISSFDDEMEGVYFTFIRNSEVLKPLASK